MVGDHLYVSPAAPGVKRLVELAEAEACSASGVQPTRESLLPRFGAVAGRRVTGRQGVYRVETVIEKPTPTVSFLILSGLYIGSQSAFEPGMAVGRGVIAGN